MSDLEKNVTDNLVTFEVDGKSMEKVKIRKTTAKSKKDHMVTK